MRVRDLVLGLPVNAQGGQAELGWLSETGKHGNTGPPPNGTSYLQCLRRMGSSQVV